MNAKNTKKKISLNQVAPIATDDLPKSIKQFEDYMTVKLPPLTVTDSLKLPTSPEAGVRPKEKKTPNFLKSPPVNQ